MCAYVSKSVCHDERYMLLSFDDLWPWPWDDGAHTCARLANTVYFYDVNICNILTYWPRWPRGHLLAVILCIRNDKQTITMSVNRQWRVHRGAAGFHFKLLKTFFKNFDHMSNGTHPRRSWSLSNHFQTGQCPSSISYRSTQMGSCQLSCLWMWTTSDDERYSWHMRRDC